MWRTQDGLGLQQESSILGGATDLSPILELQFFIYFFFTKKPWRKTKNRPQLHPQHSVFSSNFSHELWLLILNSEWLRARSGQLRVSIDIKSRICHVPQWVEEGGGVNLWAKLRCWWCSADRWLKCWWSCGSHMRNRRLPHGTLQGFKRADRLSLF